MLGSLGIESVPDPKYNKKRGKTECHHRKKKRMLIFIFG